MSPSRHAPLSLLLPLALALSLVGLAAACGDPSGKGLPCAADDNCPSALVCVAGACAAAAGEPRVPGGGDVGDGAFAGDFARNRAVTPRLPFEGVDEIEPVPPVVDGWTAVELGVALEPGSTPRVVVSGADVAVYAALAGCDGIAQIDPAAPASPPHIIRDSTDGCFVDLDVARGSSVYVAARLATADGSASRPVLMSFDATGEPTNELFPSLPLAAGVQSGVFPRVWRAGANAEYAGVFYAGWVKEGSPREVQRVAFVNGAAVEVVNQVTGTVGGYAPFVDANGDMGLFLWKASAGELVHDTDVDLNRLLDSGIGSGLDGVACGGSVHAVYREGSVLRVASVAGADAAVPDDLREGLQVGPGDAFAAACDESFGAGNETLWVAHVHAGGRLLVARRDGYLDWQIVDVGPAAGGVSLAVVAGQPHVAYGTPEGGARYATLAP